MGFLAVGVTRSARGGGCRRRCDLGWLRLAGGASLTVRGGASRLILQLRAYLPQQSFSPSATLMLSTPSTFLSVTSATPVS